MTQDNVEEIVGVNSLRAVIFDMDGLMLDTEIIYHRAWQQAAADLGYGLEDELLLQMVGIKTAECEEMVLAACGRDFPLARFRPLWREHWHTLVDRHGIEHKPGLLGLLDTLEALQVPKAVATSSTRVEADFCLARTGIAQRFVAVTAGDEVREGKPAPEIFLLAARKLAVPPEACLVLEDSAAGVLGATAAGMRTLMVPDLRQPPAEIAQRAYRVLPSLHDAVPLVEVWFR